MYKEIIIVIFFIILIVIFEKYYDQHNKNNKNNENNKIIPSFKKDIRPLFRPVDINSMEWLFDLSKYKDVKDNHIAIYNSVKNKSMPCDATGSWSNNKIGLFKRWIDTGMQE